MYSGMMMMLLCCQSMLMTFDIMECFSSVGETLMQQKRKPSIFPPFFIDYPMISSARGGIAPVTQRVESAIFCIGSSHEF